MSFCLVGFVCLFSVILDFLFLFYLSIVSRDIIQVLKVCKANTLLTKPCLHFLREHIWEHRLGIQVGSTKAPKLRPAV